MPEDFQKFAVSFTFGVLSDDSIRNPMGFTSFCKPDFYGHILVYGKA